MMRPTEVDVIAVSSLRVKRVRDVQLGHLVALPHSEQTLLGIVVESPPEMKSVRAVLAFAVESQDAGKLPYLLANTGASQCFDFGTPATFLWTPVVANINPRWHAGLKTGHLAVTENVVAINGCYGHSHVKHGYWDVSSGRMVWDKYTMFLTEWQLGIPGHAGAWNALLTFPADFYSVDFEQTQKMEAVPQEPVPQRTVVGA